MTEAQWEQLDAIALCRKVEAICPQFGCHVALTGGALYKDGPRKDCDILFYRIRQIAEIDEDGLLDALRLIGFDNFRPFGFVTKSTYIGKSVDILFPETQDGGKYASSQNGAAILSEEIGYD